MRTSLDPSEKLGKTPKQTVLATFSWDDDVAEVGNNPSDAAAFG